MWVESAEPQGATFMNKKTESRREKLTLNKETLKNLEARVRSGIRAGFLKHVGLPSTPLTMGPCC